MRLKVSRSKNAASLYCFEWLSNPFFQRNLQILAAYVTKSFYLLYRNRYASFIFRGLSCTTKPDKTRADYYVILLTTKRCMVYCSMHLSAIILILNW